MRLPSRLLIGFFLLVGSLAPAQVPHSNHVVIVTLENHSYEQAIGNIAMPYFNQLASQYGLADAYFAPQHNSLSALMWLTTGSQVTTNNSTREIFNVDHIAARAWQSGKTWKAYLESLPSIGFTDYATSGPYLKRHNPFAYFSDVVTSNQRFNLVPLDPFFAQDIANRTLPNFSYVVPDAGDDAHDGTLAQADQWLQTHIPQLLADPDFQNDGLLFIVFDEGNLSPLDTRWTGGRVATLVIGPGVKPGYRSGTFYTHQDLLRTICDAMALGGCPGNGATGVAMADFFPPAPAVSPHIQLLSPTANLNAERNPLRFVANIVSDKPASAMIVYADNREIFRTQGGHTDFKMDLSPGPHLLVVNGWDSAGTLMQARVSVNVIDQGVSANACPVSQSSPSVTICSAQGGQSLTSPLRVVAETVDQQAEVLTTAVSVDNQELYLAYGNRVDTDLALKPGVHHIVVRARDILGTTFESAADVNVLATAPPTLPAPSIILPSVLDGSSSSSPLHVAATLNSNLPATGMIVYSDDHEVLRTSSGRLDTYLDLKTGHHHVVINAWDSGGNLTTTDGVVTIAGRIESCNEYKPAVSVTICSPGNSNSAPGVPFHFVAAARSDGKTIAAMIVYADGQEIQRTFGSYIDFQAALTPGAHSMVVHAWDNSGTLMQDSRVVTVQ